MKLKDAEKRLKQEPNNLGLKVQVAGLMREAGRSLEAVELYRSVALAYRDQGRAQQAIAVCRSILEIAPEDSACQGLLAMLQQRVSAPVRQSQSGLKPMNPATPTTGRDVRQPTAPPPSRDMRQPTAPPQRDMRQPTTPPRDMRQPTAPPPRDMRQPTAPPPRDMRQPTAPPRDARQPTASPPRDTRPSTPPEPQPTPAQTTSSMPPLPEVPSLRPATSPAPVRVSSRPASPPLSRTVTPTQNVVPRAGSSTQNPLAPPRTATPTKSPIAPPRMKTPTPNLVPSPHRVTAVGHSRPVTKSPPTDPLDPRALEPARHSEPGRRSSMDQTPLPKPMPYHLADPTSQPNKISRGELVLDDDATRVDPAPGEIERRSSGRFDAGGVPKAMDLSAELDTRQRPRIESEELQKISKPPPTTPVDRLDEILDDLVTPPPPPDIDDMMTDQRHALRPHPRGSDDALTPPRTSSRDIAVPLSRASSRDSLPRIGHSPKTSSRPPGVIAIPPKPPSKPPGSITIPPKSSPSSPPGSLTPPGGTPIARVRPGPPPRPGMSKIPRDSEDELTKPRDRGVIDDDDD